MSEKDKSKTASPLQVSIEQWLRVAKRVKRKLHENDAGIISAGCSFYGLLALFPALSAVLVVSGIAFRRSDVQQQIASFFKLIPPRASELLQEQLSYVANSTDYSLSTGVAFAVIFSLWSMNQGVRSVIKALNIIYDEDEERGILHLNLISFSIAMAGLLFITFSAVALMLIPAIVSQLGLSNSWLPDVAFLRWPLLAIVLMITLAAIYRIGPNRSNAKWRWLSSGSVIATVMWLIGSALFSIYVTSFGNYDRVYGSLGGVMVLLVWLFMSVWIILFGATVNAELERQVGIDTTTGDTDPRGERGAAVANETKSGKTN